MSHPLTKWLSVIAIFFSGMFFGLMVCFLVVVDRMLTTLDSQIYTQVMQQLIRAADHPPLVPLMVIISLLAPIIYLIIERHNAHTLHYKLTALALGLFFIAFFVTVVLNVPLNTQISSWSIASPPDNWMAIRDQWHFYNIIRVSTTGVAFLAHILALQVRYAEAHTDK